VADKIMGLKVMQGADFGNEYPIGADASNVDITVNGTASNVDTVIKNIISGTQTVGNATKVNNHTVNSNVPANAKFTDTVTTVDSSLSTSSTNPVQNKIIKGELDKKLNLSGGTLTGALNITGGTSKTTNLDVAGLAFAETGIWAYDKNNKTDDGEVTVGVRYDYNRTTHNFYLHANRKNGTRGIWDSQLNGNLIGYANGKIILNAQEVSLGQWLFSNNWYVYKFTDDKRVILFRSDTYGGKHAATSFGQMYKTASSDSIGPFAYPFTFASVPIEIVVGSPTASDPPINYWVVPGSAKPTTKQTGTYDLVTPSSTWCPSKINTIVMGVLP
jgi:hypothetical protein